MSVLLNLQLLCNWTRETDTRADFFLGNLQTEVSIKLNDHNSVFQTKLMVLTEGKVGVLLWPATLLTLLWIAKGH